MRRYYALILISILLISVSCNSREPSDGMSFNEYIKYAESSLGNNNADLAIAAYKKALSLDPGQVQARIALAETYLSESNRTYRQAIRKISIDSLANPNRKLDADYERELEKFGYRRDYKQLAFNEFRVVLSYSPDNVKARRYIAMDYFDNKRYREAIAEFLEVVARNGNDCNAYSHIARSYLRMAMYEQAAKYTNQAYECGGNAEYYYYQMGKIYISTNNGEKAGEMFRKLKDMNSSYYDELQSYKFFPKTRD